MLEATQPETALAGTDAPEAQPVDAVTTTDAAAFYREPEGGDPDPQVAGEGGEEALADSGELEPIEAPASWAKDAKDVFAGLPRDAQEIVAAREKERDTEVRRAQNAVHTTRQQVEREALGQVRQIREQAAQQLQQYAQQFEVQPPDVRLLQSQDPSHHAAYYEQDRQYRIASQQRDQLSYQAQQAQYEADAIAHYSEQQALAERHAEIVEQFPDWADPAGQANLKAELEPIAAELGYSREVMARADVNDFNALKTALSWKRDSDELRSLKNKAKMIPVRAAKGIPPAGRVAAPSGQTAPVSTAAQLYPNDVRR